MLKLQTFLFLGLILLSSCFFQKNNRNNKLKAKILFGSSLNECEVSVKINDTQILEKVNILTDASLGIDLANKINIYNYYCVVNNMDTLFSNTDKNFLDVEVRANNLNSFLKIEPIKRQILLKKGNVIILDMQRDSLFFNQYKKKITLE